MAADPLGTKPLSISGGRGAVVSVKVQWQKTAAAIQKYGLAVTSDQVLAAIGLRVVRWMTENVDEKGIEKRWPLMSPNTVAANPNRSDSGQFSSRWRSRLVQSFTYVVEGNTVVVGTQDQFAGWQHHGTRPYTIRPVRAKRLRFVTVGGVRFAQVVHHPGIPARALLPTDAMARALAIEVMQGVSALAARQAGLRT